MPTFKEIRGLWAAESAALGFTMATQARAYMTVTCETNLNIMKIEEELDEEHDNIEVGEETLAKMRHLLQTLSVELLKAPANSKVVVSSPRISVGTASVYFYSQIIMDRD